MRLGIHAQPLGNHGIDQRVDPLADARDVAVPLLQRLGCGLELYEAVHLVYHGLQGGRRKHAGTFYQRLQGGKRRAITACRTQEVESAGVRVSGQDAEGDALVSWRKATPTQADHQHTPAPAGEPGA